MEGSGERLGGDGIGERIMSVDGGGRVRQQKDGDKDETEARQVTLTFHSQRFNLHT